MWVFFIFLIENLNGLVVCVCAWCCFASAKIEVI